MSNFAPRPHGRRVTRMTGVDAGFLYMETPTMHMHTLKIGILEASPNLTFDRLVEGTMARLRRMPPLRRRIVPVPFALNHPLLLTQRRPDPARHFIRHHLGGAGTMRDLEDLIGRIASTPLDRSAPLWELHVCEGLEGGRIAVVGKIHHALADGVAANALLANVMDAASAELRPAIVADFEDETEAPTRTAMMREALGDATRQARFVPRLVLNTVVALTRVLGLRRAGGSAPLPIKDVPRVSFNGPLTARRSFATVSLSLADCKQVRAVHPEAKATLNDVVLALTSGALRSWLADHDEHPSGSLIAGVPVGMDAAGSPPRLIGNNVSNMFTTLATDIDDPGERLAIIATTTRTAKQINAYLGSSLADWSQFAPPAIVSAFMRWYSRVKGAGHHTAPFSAIVSNVPGPRERVNIGGAALDDLFSVGPLIEGIGLNVTVWSYIDRMNFSLLACPDLLPDVHDLAARFPAALDELLGVTGRDQSATESAPHGKETA